MFCPPNVGDKVSVFGSCGMTCWNGTSWEDVNSSTGVDNVGAGQGLFMGHAVDGDIRLRSIVATGMAQATILPDGTLRINVPQVVLPSGGEVNTMSSVGGGTSIFKTKNGVNFEMKTLIAGDNISFIPGTDTVRIDATVPAATTYTAASLGSGAHVYSTVVSNQFRFRSLVADTEAGVPFSLVQGTDTISFRFKPSEGLVDVWQDMSKLYDATPNEYDIMHWNGADSWVHAPIVIGSVSGAAAEVFAGRTNPFSFEFRGIRGGTGISATEDTEDVVVALDVDVQNLGTGVGVLAGWSGDTVQANSLKAGPGIELDSSTPGEILISGTSGGGSGPGVSGTALVGQFRMSGTQNLDRWGVARTYLRFNTNMLTVATIAKNVNGDEFTINRAGKYRLSAKATVRPGSGQMHHSISIEHYTVSNTTWNDIPASMSWVTVPAQEVDIHTMHTGVIVINAAVGDKFRVGVITNGGVSLPVIQPEGNNFVIEEVVGPIWEVVTETTTARSLTENDNGKVIRTTNGSAVTITLPSSLSVSFGCKVIQDGAGQITFQAGSGATLHNRQSHNKTAGQRALVELVVKTNVGGSAAVYNLSGDTAS